MTFDRICGKCGAPISSEQDACPKCPPPAPPKKGEAVPALLVAAVLCTSLLMLGTSVVNVVNAPKTDPVKDTPAEIDMKGAAYEAAKSYVQEQFPGNKQFADFYQTPIAVEGTNYIVTLSADDLEGASQARRFYTVELVLVNNSWVLKEIKR